MNAITINITDRATPELQKLMAKVKPDQLARIARQPLETLTRVHLVKNGPNKKGWPSTGFWAAAARQTTATASGGTVTIDIDKIGVRQRAFGGPIYPVKAEALAYPISPVSYGHLPREFPNLKLISIPKGAYLVQFNGHKNASLTFLFKISGGVWQAPDPKVVPSAGELTEAVIAAIHRSIAP
jgi:hypothetical protein